MQILTEEHVNQLDASILIARNLCQKLKVRFPLFRSSNANLSRFATHNNITPTDNGVWLADVVGVIEFAAVTSTDINCLRVLAYYVCRLCEDLLHKLRLDVLLDEFHLNQLDIQSHFFHPNFMFSTALLILSLSSMFLSFRSKIYKAKKYRIFNKSNAVKPKNRHLNFCFIFRA